MSKNKNEEKKFKLSVTIILSIIIFCILYLTHILVVILIYHGVRRGLINFFQEALINPGNLILFLMIVSTIVGSVVTFIINRFPLRYIDKIENQLNLLAKGDYSARLNFGRPLKKLHGVEKISKSFNSLAEELQSTELLRSDFINNFSHEFKTPIVSIAGFAKLLRKGNLTEEQKQEYLVIIEEESLRLSNMATNMLNMTKLENQIVLSDITEYNLSEQIRSCILVLEQKWSEKNLELHIDFDEHKICANYEMMKQVWINLIDNAVKFSYDYGVLEILIIENNDEITVSITNDGDEISEENKKRIFNKFYQADESHTSEGNGIGLAIVKKVIELHSGSIKVESKNNKTTFTVELPKI